jgi:hypothetical protein
MRGLKSSRWFAAAAVAFVAIAGAANDAQARRGVLAFLTNANPSTCKAPSGQPWHAGMIGGSSGGGYVCEVYTQGSTAYAPCPSTATQAFGVIADPGPDYSYTPAGVLTAHVVAYSAWQPWGQGIALNYTSPSCSGVSASMGSVF